MRLHAGPAKAYHPEVIPFQLCDQILVLSVEQKGLSGLEAGQSPLLTRCRLSSY